MNARVKLGNIFTPTRNSEWMSSHAAVPFVEKLIGSQIKIYFSSRNQHNKSLIGWVIIDIENPAVILKISSDPIMDLGGAGFFDEDGVMGCELVHINESKYLYYVGWNIGSIIPFRNAIGLAIFNNNLNRFVKYSDGPILDRSIYDPCFVASNCVLQKDGEFLMYYLSCIKWEIVNQKYNHQYHIKMASSNDGINWNREGRVVIDFEHKNEYAISVPRVLLIHGKYRMWYSYRGSSLNDTYRIGYAESDNALDWIRKDDQVGIDVSKDGWDSEMICYPYIFEYKTDYYMLYNGNEYGKSGFGIAKMKK